MHKDAILLTPLTREEREQCLPNLDPRWQINHLGHLYACYDFPDFMSAIKWATAIATLADAEAHHPDLTIKWGKCEVEIWTHDIQALTWKDFALAQKIDTLKRNKPLRKNTGNV